MATHRDKAQKQLQADVQASLLTNTRDFELMEERGAQLREATRKKKLEFDIQNRMTESRKKLGKL